MFAGNHVLNIALHNIHHFYMSAEGNLPKVPPMSCKTICHVLLELTNVSKSFQDVILTSTTRKNKVDNLIKLMSLKVVEASTSHVA